MAKDYTYIGPSLYSAKKSPRDAISFETMEIKYNGQAIEVVPSIKKDIDLINESIYRILTTSKGERVYLRSFGCNLKSYVFEQLDSIQLSIVDKEIRNVLDEFEPRIKVNDVSVTKTDEHTIGIQLMYSVILDKQYSVSTRFIL